MDKPNDEKKELIPDTYICGRGRLRPGVTEHINKFEVEVLLIKKVPALICDLCDEAYLIPETFREIDKMVKDFREGRLLARPIATGEVDLRVKEAAG